jgi:rubrerythrin
MFSRSLFRFGQKKRFDELAECEVLALAISAEEEEDGAIYSAYAEKLRPDYPASAAVFEAMAAEEGQHRKALIDLYRSRFGDFIMPIRREHIATSSKCTSGATRQCSKRFCSHGRTLDREPCR